MPKPAIREGGSFRLNEGHFSDPRSTYGHDTIPERWLQKLRKREDLENVAKSYTETLINIKTNYL